MDKISIHPIEINGEKYYNTRQFAILTGLSEASIYYLMKQGNKIRKLKTKTIKNVTKAPLIEAKELHEFIFTCAGRKNNRGETKCFTFNQDKTVNEFYKVIS